MPKKKKKLTETQKVRKMSSLDELQGQVDTYLEEVTVPYIMSLLEHILDDEVRKADRSS